MMVPIGCAGTIVGISEASTTATLEVPRRIERCGIHAAGAIAERCGAAEVIND